MVTWIVTEYASQHAIAAVLTCQCFARAALLDTLCTPSFRAIARAALLGSCHTVYVHSQF